MGFATAWAATRQHEETNGSKGYRRSPWSRFILHGKVGGGPASAGTVPLRSAQNAQNEVKRCVCVCEGEMRPLGLASFVRSRLLSAKAKEAMRGQTGQDLLKEAPSFLLARCEPPRKHVWKRWQHWQ